MIEDRAAAGGQRIERTDASYVGRETAEERPGCALQDLDGAAQCRLQVGVLTIDGRLACTGPTEPRQRVGDPRAIDIGRVQGAVIVHDGRDVVAEQGAERAGPVAHAGRGCRSG